MQEHVLELDENNKATAEGIPAAGAWVPNEQGFYRYVTQPARPVLASNTDEENVRYNVPIPFSVPRFAPQAVGNSFWLVARQGFRHMSNHFSAESWSQVSFPSVSLPKINLPQLPQININFPKIRFNTVKVVKKQGTLIGGWSHKSVKPDYNSTIQRMKRVQADLKHSWQNFDPVIANTTTPLTRRPIKNQWDLPPVKKSQKTSEPCPLRRLLRRIDRGPKTVARIRAGPGAAYGPVRSRRHPASCRRCLQRAVRFSGIRAALPRRPRR